MEFCQHFTKPLYMLKLVCVQNTWEAWLNPNFSVTFSIQHVHMLIVIQWDIFHLNLLLKVYFEVQDLFIPQVRVLPAQLNRNAVAISGQPLGNFQIVRHFHDHYILWASRYRNSLPMQIHLPWSAQAAYFTTIFSCTRKFWAAKCMKYAKILFTSLKAVYINTENALVSGCV